MDNQFQWVDFYKEFAGKLLAYKNNRTDLIEKVKDIYGTTGINMPTLERDNQIVDIDPFTVFGLFNKSSMREANRIKIITAVKDLFGVETPAPTSFNSIPVLNNQNATFYYFAGDRGADDIDNLWGLFEAGLSYASNPSQDALKNVSRYFDLVINKKGNGNSKVTMGLYWIAPHAFLNMDSRNEWYIYESGKIPVDVVSSLPSIETKIAAQKYFAIVEKLRAYLQSGSSELKDFKELSFAAWNYSTKVNNEIKAEKKAANQRAQKGAGLADDDVDTQRYWIYAPGDKAVKWDEFYKLGVMGLGWEEIGDLKQYASKDEMKEAMKAKIDPTRPYKNAAHATWQFANEIKPGDIVFVKKGMYQLVGRGVVTSDYYYNPSVDAEYPHLHKVNWTNIGEWEHPGQAVMKTLTDITSYTEYVEKLNALFEDDEEGEEIEEVEKSFPAYTPEDFLNEVYMDADRYDTLVDLIRIKKNVILQGAPGVGKTFAAKRLAYSMMGVKDQDRVMMVQFHQSYTYEDFIEGFRPSSGSAGFEIKKGSFYNFCKKAADDLDNEYFFIIDEINRGNLSKIFGELFMLIESDKRGNALQLLYSDEKFFVPANVYIIGMMNTADRSLAMLDYALRRRFAFFSIIPGFSAEGFKKYKDALNSDRFNNLIACIEELNDKIATDASLGEGFCIGHSYFCGITTIGERTLSNIVEYEMVPLLNEYWYDEPIKVRDWTDRLRSAIK
ncbi:TPA: AAA family ATPase [Streptococcus equi subsp. zooepidemicus]|nr:AAA family ATPase [Streptococcus equi subsp. zooepidemicus]HEL1316405.1 AAA family ATPase [Streptococcus equi subsp. zooepidemicus]